MRESAPSGLTRRGFLDTALRAAGAWMLVLAAPRASAQDRPGPPARWSPPRPRGLCFLPDGGAIVTAADDDGYVLLRVSPDGASVSTLVPVHPAEEDGLNLPTKLARWGDEQIAVVDTNRCRIRIYGLDGTPARTVGAPGFTPGRFHYPQGLAVSEGLLWVADTGNHRVQAVDKYGGVDRVIGMLGDAPDRFRRPRDLARLKDGTLLVLDEGHAAVKCFDDSGHLRARIELPGGGFARADALAVDEDRGWVCVAMSGLGRVLVFGLDGRARGAGLTGVAASALAFHPDGRLGVADLEGGRVAFYDLRG